MRTVAIVGLALVLAALAAAPASGLPRNFFGMVTYERPTPAELQQMAAGGVQTVRFSVHWGNVEPTAGAPRDWSYYDSLIASMASVGLTPNPLFDGSPGWISEDSHRPPIYSESQKSAWARFVTDFAARYGNGGAFWQQHPELPYRPLTYWSVWNEPSLRHRWGGAPSPRGYLELLRITRRALLQGDPQARIVFAGTFPDPRARYGTPLTRYLKGIYAHRDARKLFDVFALHPYSITPAQVLKTCREIRRILDDNRDRRTPLWITELGWSTSGYDAANSPYHTTEAGQARNLERSFTMLIKARKQLRLRHVDWHAWKDFSGDPSSVAQMGLFRADGTAKPSWSAYQSVARR